MGWNEDDIDEYLDNQDSYGDWVVINVRGISPDRALEICRHEVGHEIFALNCQRSKEGFERCMEVIKIEDENNKN